MNSILARSFRRVSRFVGVRSFELVIGIVECLGLGAEVGVAADMSVEGRITMDGRRAQQVCAAVG